MVTPAKKASQSRPGYSCMLEQAAKEAGAQGLRREATVQDQPEVLGTADAEINQCCTAKCLLRRAVCHTVTGIDPFACP